MRSVILQPTIESGFGGYVSADVLKRYKDIWGDSPSSLLRRYNYQPELTKKLDDLAAGELDIEVFYEIVLWKLNRFPQISSGLLKELGSVRKISAQDYKTVGPILKKMLRCRGIALPMASTILRFLNPDSFQIIDDRVYRIVRPGQVKYPTKPPKPNAAYLDSSVNIYFEYLNDLRQLCCDELPFSKADRILYQLDIELGNRIGDEG